LARAPTSGAYAYVYDFQNNKLKKYQVTSEPAPNGQRQYFVDPATPTSAESQYFALARLTWNGNGRNLQALTTRTRISVTQLIGLPSRTGGSGGYGIVLYGARQIDLLNCVRSTCFDPDLADSSGIVESVLSLLNNASTMLFKDHLLDLTVEVVLLDGSVITIEWTPGQQPKIVLVVDASGNPIPLSKAEFDNPRTPYGSNYDFGDHHGDLSQFIQLAQSYGAQVSTGGGWRIACVSYNGIRSCTAYPR